MDLSFSPDDLAFREEVRAWIRTDMPPDLAAIAAVDGHFDHAAGMRWHELLFAKGWVAPHWPKEHGGPGLSATRRIILTQEATPSPVRAATWRPCARAPWTTVITSS